MCLKENCKSLVLQDKCNIEIVLSPEEKIKERSEGMQSMDMLN